MSAKNWSVCPRCKCTADGKRSELKEKIDREYGNVPREVYMRLAKEYENPPVLREAMREDYQIGVSPDGTFSVTYSCACEECGFAHEFRKEQKLDTARVTT